MATKCNIFLCFAMLFYVHSATLPANPCPDLFQYRTENGMTIGTLEFPNDFSGNFELAVNVSLATLLYNRFSGSHPKNLCTNEYCRYLEETTTANSNSVTNAQIFWYVYDGSSGRHKRSNFKEKKSLEFENGKINKRDVSSNPFIQRQIQTGDYSPFPNNQFLGRNPSTFEGKSEPNRFNDIDTRTANDNIDTYGNSNIKLQLVTPHAQLRAGYPVRYHIYFPIQEILPKLTQVVYNGQVHCSGPPEELLPGRGVTSMWANTYFRTYMDRYPTYVKPSKPPDTLYPIVTPYIQPIQPFSKPAPPPKKPRPPPTMPTVPTKALFTSPPLQTSPPPPTPALPSPRPSMIGTHSTKQCGIASDFTPLIVNGFLADLGESPWLAALMYRENFNYKYRCTANLVTSQHVITAGHCVQFYQAFIFPKEDLLLVMGKSNIRNWAHGGLLRDINEIMVHPNYQESRGEGDIAVLKLSAAVVFKLSVKPLCLWDNSQEPINIVSQQGTVVGWGSDESGRSYVNEARKITLPVAPKEECVKFSNQLVNTSSDRVFCVGRRDGSGPCTGDSGVGFIMRQNGRWALKGVASVPARNSRGDSCDLSSYAVFVDVAKFVDWIESVISQN